MTIAPLILAALVGATAAQTGKTSPTSDVSANRVRATGSTTSRSTADIAADSISIKAFGAVGNGVANDRAAFVAAAASGAHTIIVPPGRYVLGDIWTVTGSNMKFVGTPGGSVLTSSIIDPVQLGSMTNVAFEGLTFESTFVGTSDYTWGVVWSNDDGMSNVTFDRCTFTAPNAGNNGLKLKAEATGVVEGLTITNSRFESLGRMGLELQNHNDGTPLARFRNVVIRNNVFKNTGLAGSYGMAVSVSGISENVTVEGNVIDNCYDTGLEFVGPSRLSVIRNHWRNLTRACHPLALTGSRRMYGVNISENRTESEATGSVKVWTSDDVTMTGNVWKLTEAVDIRNTNRVRGVAEHYDTSGFYALYLDSTTTNSEWVSSYISNSRSASNFATIRAYGAGVTKTRIISSFVNHGTGGAVYDSQNGAEAIKMYLSERTDTGAMMSDAIPGQAALGKTAKTGFTKFVGATDTISFTVDLGSSSGSWLTGYITVKVSAIRTDSSGYAFGEVRYRYRYLDGQNAVLVATDTLTAPSGLTVGAASAGAVVTITVTHGTLNTNLNFMVDAEATSAAAPTITPP